MMMKKRGLFAITVLLFIAAMPTASADSGWWDADWSQRKAITVTENSGSTLTNYQVKLTGEWLAFRIQDYADVDDDGAVVSVGLSSSYLTSGGTDPAYPVPELPAMVLFSVGLLVLVGYIRLKRKD